MNIFFVLLSLLIPPLGIPLGLLGIYFDQKHWKSYAFCLAYAAGSAAYCYETNGTSDITRYFEYIDGIRGISLRDFFTYGKYGSEGEALYIFNLFCWVAGAINDPHIIPFISVFIIYYISIFVYCEIGNDYKIRGRDLIWGIVFIFAALNFYSLVNNIRNVLSFTIVGYAVYSDCYKKRHNIWTLFLYVMPIFIHSSVVILIVLRLLLFFAGKMKILGTVIALTLMPILEILHRLAQGMTSSSLKYVKKAISMAYNYFNDKSAIEWGLEAQASGSEKVFKIAYIAIMLIVCLTIVWLIKEMNKKDKQNNRVSKYMSYVFYVGLMGISCLPMIVPIYWRFAATTIALGGGVFPLSLKTQGKHVALRQIIWCLLLILGAICMIVWIWRLSYGNSIYSVFIKPFYSSPIINIPIKLTGIINV